MLSRTENMPFLPDFEGVAPPEILSVINVHVTVLMIMVQPYTYSIYIYSKASKRNIGGRKWEAK